MKLNEITYRESTAGRGDGHPGLGPEVPDEDAEHHLPAPPQASLPSTERACSHHRSASQLPRMLPTGPGKWGQKQAAGLGNVDLAGALPRAVSAGRSGWKQHRGRMVAK